MSSQQEVESMVARLTGDSTEYVKMLKDAIDQTDEAAREIEDAAKEVESFGSKLTSAGERITDFGANLTHIGNNIDQHFGSKIRALGHESFNAFLEGEGVAMKLKGALEANGRAVEQTFGRYTEFAAEIQKLTVVGDEATLTMLQQAETFGYTGDAAEKVVKNAIGLSRAMGMGEQSALRYSVALEEGNSSMLSRYIPTLKSIEDESERAEEAQRKLTAMFTVAKREAESTSGVIAQMKNSWGDLTELFGEVIAEAIAPLSAALRDTYLWLQSLSPEGRKFIVIVGALIAGIGPALVMIGGLIGTVGFVATSIGSAFTLIASVGAPALLAIGGIAAAVVALGAAIVAFVGTERLKDWFFDATKAADHFLKNVVGFFTHFKENVGIIIDWFGDNWDNMIFDANTVFMEVMKSLPTNVSVAIETMTRLFMAFAGWINIAVPRFFYETFGPMLSDAVMRGLNVALRIIQVWVGEVERVVGATAEALSEILSKAMSGDADGVKMAVAKLAGDISLAFGAKANGIIEQMKKDFSDGAKDVDIFSTFGTILKEQAAKLKNPLDDIKFTTDPLMLHLGDAGDMQTTTEGIDKVTDSIKNMKRELGDNEVVTRGSKELRDILRGMNEDKKPDFEFAIAPPKPEFAKFEIMREGIEVHKDFTGKRFEDLTFREILAGVKEFVAITKEEAAKPKMEIVVGLEGGSS